MRMKNPIIQLENISKIYRSGKFKVTALTDINLEIYKKDFVSVIGTSGAGKSTLLHLIGALDKPTNGTIYVNGNDISKLSDYQLAQFRKQNVGFVFQFFNLIPTLTALENVLVSKLFDDNISITRGEEVLKMVGLSTKLEHKPNELSGGEQQRVAIARALYNDPEIILADEPTGNIDTKTGYELLKLFRKLNRAGTTMVLVTHDAQIARAGNRVVKMRDGKIVTK
jgi:putative ABC transport system ATP-binding protein